MSSKKAAMEMSIGTLVTIVLLMVVLGLGIFLIQKIFRGGGSFVDEVNTEVQNQVDTLFSQNKETKVALIPISREISLPKGSSGGIALSIRNTELTQGVFTYETEFVEKQAGCTLTPDQARNLIILGREGRDIRLGSGDSMESAILIRFDVPETAPLCKMRYSVNVEKDGATYGSTTYFDVEIVS